MAGPRYDHFVMRQYQATDAVAGDAHASVLPAARRAIVAGVNTWAVIAARYHFSDVWRQQRGLVGEFLGTKNPELPTLDAEGLRIKMLADKRHEIDMKRDEELRKVEGTIFDRSRTRRPYAESAAAYMKLLGDFQEKFLRPKFLKYVEDATFSGKAEKHPPLRVWLALSEADADAALNHDDWPDLYDRKYEDSDEILVDFEHLIIGHGHHHPDHHLQDSICEDEKFRDLFEDWTSSDEALDVDEWGAFLPWLGVYAAAVPEVAKECGLQMRDSGTKLVPEPTPGEKLGGGGRYLSYEQPSGFAELFTFVLGSS